MEKTNCLLDAVKNQLQNAISNIDAGNSNLNEEEMEELVKTLSVLNKGVKRISKAYACEHILHCSPATFDNYVRAGIIPKGKKEIGFNELSWSLKDFDGVKLQRIHNDKKFKSINSNITFWDVYVALNAQYHDNIELYKEWFGEDNIENIKDKIIESAIVNWFEDEDAGIEKVWNYFRAI